MPKVACIVGRFPERELAIRRLCAHDPDFVAICEDYDEAVGALRHWQAVGTPGDPRTEDYRLLVTDLETEILARLDRSRDRRPRPLGD